ncbi:hypothetical protein NL529_27510, partial [Klebsiella pneumoniae]|nr:hypothetical protein [Klebsiella pneumoniae]
PLAGRGYQELPKFLSKKKAIINIQNTDNRCFGCAILYFKDRPNTDNHFERPNLYTEEMFENNNLVDLPYPIFPNDVHLYEDQLALNINVFSFFDEEGKARHPLY